MYNYKFSNLRCRELRDVGKLFREVEVVEEEQFLCTRNGQEPDLFIQMAENVIYVCSNMRHNVCCKLCAHGCLTENTVYEGMVFREKKNTLVTHFSV